MTASAPFLNYGTRRRHAWRKWTVVILLLLGSFYVTRRFEPVITRKYRMLTAQRACMNFVSDASNPNMPADRDHCANRFTALMYDTRYWGGTAPCVFVGRLRNKHGERLAIVWRCQFALPGDSIPWQDSLEGLVIEPASLFRDPREISLGWVDPTSAPHFGAMNQNPAHRVGANQTLDGSSFDIFFREGTRGDGLNICLKGWLDDQDKLRLVDTCAQSAWKEYQGRIDAHRGSLGINGQY